LAEQLAVGPGAATADELLAQPSPSKSGMTLSEQKEDLFNRIREVFRVGRIIRVESSCGGYSHNAGTIAGVLVQVEGGNDEAAKDVAMHVAAMRPAALSEDELDPEMIAKEREFLRAAAMNEGKPENIVDKIVDGRIKQFIAERALLYQPFVKDDKQTVEEYAKSHGMTVKAYWHWVLTASAAE
jgi:elongation factor Ts